MIVKPLELTRRSFLKALAASVLAAGVTLPVGLRREHLLFVNDSALPGGDGRSRKTAFRTLLMATNRIEPGGTIYVKGMHSIVKLDGSPDISLPTRFVGYDGGIQCRKKEFNVEGSANFRNLAIDMPSEDDSRRLQLYGCTLTNSYRPSTT